MCNDERETGAVVQPPGKPLSAHLSAITALIAPRGQIMAYRLSISRIDWNGELTEIPGWSAVGS
jgi:hypothetical protein